MTIVFRWEIETSTARGQDVYEREVELDDVPRVEERVELHIGESDDFHSGEVVAVVWVIGHASAEAVVWVYLDNVVITPAGESRTRLN